MRTRIMTIITVAFAAVALMGSTAASAAGTTGGEEPNGDVGTTAKEYDDAKVHGMTGYGKECLDRDDVKGCVMPYGDILWLDDQEADGWGVKLLWWDTEGPRLGECANNHGALTGWTRCNKDLPEGHVIKWKVSWYEGGEWHNSSAAYTTA